MIKKIRKIVKHAYENTEYYKKIYKDFDALIKSEFTLEEFKKIPFTDKGMLYKEGEILSKKRNLEATVLVRTSGTTGQCVTAYWNQADFNRSMLELWLIRRRYGISTGDKCCRFFTNLYIGNSIVKSSQSKQVVNEGKTLMISKSALYGENLEDIYHEIRAYQPAWLYLQPSVARMLLDVKEKKNLEKINSIRYIELTGENCMPDLKERLEKEFACAVGNMYGMIEVNGIAYGELNEGLNILKSNVYVEIVKDREIIRGGEVGEICVTSLTNYEMPIIRYLTGDFGYIKDGKLFLLKGRKSEYIKLRNGDIIPIYVLFTPIERINDVLGGVITDARFIQRNYNEIEANFVLKKGREGWEKQIEKLFMEHIACEEGLKGIKWNVFFEKRLDDFNYGKKKCFFASHLREEE